MSALRGENRQQPLVSIVTPCYRQGHLLPQAIESVRSQTYQNIEHIIVNDGSDDDTEAVALGYGDTVRYIHKPNGGLSSARNAGLAAARGTYAIFLDADDLIPPTGVESFVRGAAGRTDVLVVGAWQHFVIDPHVDPTPPQHPITGEPAIRTLIYDDIAPVHACMAPTKRLIAQRGFDETLRSCEDWDCWNQLVLDGISIVTVPDVVCWYRNVPNSMSKDGRRMLMMRTKVLLKIHRRLISSPLLPAVAFDLLKTETRVLRKLLVQGVADASLIREVRMALGELHRAGFTLPASPGKRLVNRLLGTYAEDVAVAAFRLTSPTMRRYYQQGHL